MKLVSRQTFSALVANKVGRDIPVGVSSETSAGSRILSFSGLELRGDGVGRQTQIVEQLLKIGAGKVSIERMQDEANSDDIFSAMVMSTATPDRSLYVVKQDGWRLDNYRKNPVLLFAHDSKSLPVGRAEEVWVGDDSLRGVFKFAREETYEFGAQVGRMVRDGFLNAGSVGFNPIEFRVAEERIPEGHEDDFYYLFFPPMDFNVQELLEHTVCPVPANPEALIESRDGQALVRWAARTIDEGANLFPRDVLDRLVAHTLGRTTTSLPARRTDVNQKDTKQAADQPTKTDRAEGEAAPAADAPTETRAEGSGRCPECGHEAALSAFEVPDEGAESMSTDALVGELQRRGYVVDVRRANAAAATRSDDDVVGDLDGEDLGDVVRLAVRSALDQELAKRSY